ncbi:MAG TPA: phospholipase D-like domain-containing protein [Vicinamibacterales bacterium]|nr:phospholipase D-like domain-containing protein [Vicinamibacterales bacterium]
MSKVSIRAASLSALRSNADQVFRRSAGAPLIPGNAVRVLRNARENYPAWEDAINNAQSTIHVEMYIVHHDAVGRRFIELLAARARAGVRVRVLYDWFGCFLGPVLGLFTPLTRAGGEVRACNPPRFSAALGWTRRNHRKYICVDGRLTYISGLCMGRMWVGQPQKRLDPWRDTGIEIIGPATAAGERGFAESWSLFGGGTEPVEYPDEQSIAPAGDVALRLIYTEPFAASMLRVDLLVAAMARQRLWIADAYFIGHGPYVLALQQAARDGVDVRLLLPQGSDVGWTVPVSRTLYRTLLDAGVRIFEWNGTMMHAKTAVADSQWARIGSTNLNLNSWVGNWELDVAIEDAGVARTLEAHYEEDLDASREIVAEGTHGHAPLWPAGIEPEGLPRGRAPGATRRAARRALRTATRVGQSISAAVMGSRQLEAWESAPLATIGSVLLLSAIVGIWQPHFLSWPLAALAIWIGLSFVAQAMGFFRGRNLP